MSDSPMKVVKRTGVTLFLLFICFVLGVVFSSKFNGFTKLTHPNIQSSQSTSATMVKNLEKVNQHVFMTVGIQDVEAKQNNLKIPWTEIGVPLTEKKALIILNYNAKLGINQPVKIDFVDPKKVVVNVPKFTVIGIALDKKNPYKLYDNSGSLLSASTSNVDTGELAAQALSNDKQTRYLKTYEPMIQDSAKDYYTTLIQSLGEDISVKVKFDQD